LTAFVELESAIYAVESPRAFSVNDKIYAQEAEQSDKGKSLQTAAMSLA